MSSNLENFKPKLRAGRVIPQGSNLIFETDNPYNQVVLPMSLADLVLLCSGQFSVREIIEKIYKKQGLVPFRSILTALHVFHQGGFFENGHELVLSSDLRSWMEPRNSRWHLSWRFGQRIVSDNRSPITYYLATLLVLVVSLFGVQLFPSSPLKMIESWMSYITSWEAVSRLLLASSILLTLKHILRGLQLLLLTGKAYNISIRVSGWGSYLHIGNEANDLFENRLYTVMFYVSQILMPWSFLFLASFFVDQGMLEPFVAMTLALTFWELNPFIDGDGLRLVRSLFIANDRDVASRHFESNQLIDSISPEQRRQDQDFGRICAIWGGVWLVLAFTMLHQSAITFGPDLLRRISALNLGSFLPALGLIGWLFSLYLVVQSLVEKVATTLLRSHWRRFKTKVKKWAKSSQAQWQPAQVAAKIESLPLFSHFHEQYLQQIIEHSEIMQFPPGAPLIKEGDLATDLFVLLEGDVEIIRTGLQGNSEWVTEFSPVSIFGEAALVDDQPRLIQVNSKTSVFVLRVPVSVLREAAEEARSIRYLEDFRNAILVNQFFASSPVFRSLSTASIDFLSSRGTLDYFDQNQFVFAQGDTGDCLYLILRGSVDVIVHSTPVKRLTQGNFFGEIALIANIPRTATIITNEPSVLFKISSDAFWEILVQHIDLGVFLETISESRLREDLEIVPIPKTGTDS